MKIAFLVVNLAGYVSSCLEELARLPDTEILVVRQKPSDEAPYSLDEISPNGVGIRTYPSLPDGAVVSEQLGSFKPDVVMVAGWQVVPFRQALRELPKSTLRVLFMDNQWLATPKQFAGVLIAPWYVHSLFDIAFIPGRNQEVFARKLGFDNRRIWRGANTCDHPSFDNPPRTAPDPAFLYVGRLIESKGISVLVEAYRIYRSACAAPWGLEICGAGPLAGLLEGVDGVRVLDFIQPSALPEVYSRAGCFVLPSLFEPWGIVIHEAAASSLPVVCSHVCGAAPHLVEDGVSGFIVEAGDAKELADRMLTVTGLPEEERRRMGEAGHELSLRYTPERWSRLFRERSVESIAALKG